MAANAVDRHRPGTGVHAGITGNGAGEERNNAMEVKLMETTMNNIRPDTSTPAAEARPPRAASRPAGRPGDDVVRLSEFKLALWVGGFALAAILGGQGFLYAAIMDLQRDVHTQVGGLRAEMHAEINGLRADLHTQINELRADLQTQINELRTDVQTQINELRTDVQAQFGDLRERVARIETHLGIAAAPPGEPAN